MQITNSNVCDCPTAIKARCKCSGCGNKLFKCFHRYSMIMASAGTGKTYNLAMRYLQLLSFGIDPSEILAVTFTKKAAGEIFDKIINRLMEMVEDDSTKNCSLASKEKLTGILKKLLTSSSDLRISTIDSFFSSLLRVYSPELGLPPDINIIDSKDDRPTRNVLRQWIRYTTAEEREELRELLKNVSNGEQINFEASMIKLLKDLYISYLATLHGNGEDVFKWGETFDFESKLETLTHDECLVLHDKLLAYAASVSQKAQKERIESLAKYISNDERGNIPDSVKKLLENFNKNNNETWLFDNCMPLAYTTKISISEEQAKYIRTALRFIVKQKIEQCRKKTLAVHSLIKKFDDIYTREVRLRGNLTFADQPLLLRNSEESGIFHLSSSEDMNMEERLDATINHYLFDEFQDTSNDQWYIFENLIDEILFSYDDRFRSLFCVGDIKQSIYQWRGGDPCLFGKVIEKSLPAAENLGYDPRESLFESYRSSGDILDTVNRVFDGKNTPEMFRHCLDVMEFSPHASKKKDFDGFSALINTADIEKESLIEMQANIIIDTLHKISPFSRKQKLTVGVLMQKNDDCALLADKIKELCTDLPVSVDGYIKLQSSMAFAVMKHLLILSEHPGDPMAKGVLQMLSANGSTPVTPADIARDMNYRTGDKVGCEKLAECIREDIFKNGLAGFIQHFLDVYGSKFSNFDYDRIEAARALAEKFTGTTEEYLHAVDEWHKLKDQSVSSTIQFMTIHKSKGLEFDIVFLPDIKSREHKSYNNLECAHPLEATNHVRWINYFPNSDIMKVIPELMTHQWYMERERLFEECCKFYVAMTRAKRAMYIFADAEKADELDIYDKSPHFQDIMCRKLAECGRLAESPELDDTLDTYMENSSSVIYTTGKEDWYLRIKNDDVEQETAPTNKQSARTVLIPSAARKKLASHQHENIFAVSGEHRFAPRKGAETGTLLHELFEKLQYITEDFNAKEFAAATKVSPEIADLFVNSLAPDSEIRKYLIKPQETHTLWLEKRFLLKDEDGTLIPGAFDRVTIFLDESGNMQRAEILDYKSDNVEKSEELIKRHHLQLKLYRSCLRRMTGIPEEKIKLYIAALRTAQIIEIKA